MGGLDGVYINSHYIQELLASPGRMQPWMEYINNQAIKYILITVIIMIMTALTIKNIGLVTIPLQLYFSQDGVAMVESQHYAEQRLAIQDDGELNKEYNYGEVRDEYLYHRKTVFI